MRRHSTFFFKSLLIVVFVLKKSIQPLKNWSFAWRYCLFLLKNTSQPRKKLKFCMKKWQKNEKKGTKKTTQPRKNWSFAWKKCIFLHKKTTQPRKKLKFGMKKCQKIDKKIDQKICHFFKKSTQLLKKLKKILFVFNWCDLFFYIKQ